MHQIAGRPIRHRRNVLGGPLESCSNGPITGYYRNGCCDTGPDDVGVHTVCCIVTDDFLAYSRSRGNDLITPRPEFNFPGLRPGDRWCVCAGRWNEAYEAGHACPVVLSATHEASLEFVTLEALLTHAISPKPERLI